MLTIKEVKKEYFRIEKLLKKEALNGDEYRRNCKEGYSTHFIRRDLGLSYNGMKEIIGAKLATSSNRSPIKAKKEIHCGRDGGKMIKISECLVGCTPHICTPCPNKQLQNIQASPSTTPKEDRELNYTGSFGNSGAMAEEEGLYAI
jgi:hypothetical protein